MAYTEKWVKHYKPADMFPTADGPSWHPPEADTKAHLDAEGKALCFFQWASYLKNGRGYWWTPTIPVSSLTSDPGASNFKLTSFTCNRLAEWKGVSLIDDAALWVELDTIRIVDRTLPHIQGEIELNIPLDLLGTNIRFGLWQRCGAGVPGDWVDLHIWNYIVRGTYETLTPPEPRTLTVRVYSPQGPVANATVELLSGLIRITSGTTDGSGLVTLNAYNRAYTVKVWASNHTPYPYIAEVDLQAGNASIDAPLLFIAPPVLPWWVWPLAIGTAIIGGFIILKKPRPPPILVVK